MKKYKIVRILTVMVMAIITAIHPSELYSTRSDDEIIGGGEKIGKLYYQLNQDNMTATVAPPPYKPGIEGTTNPTYVYYDTYEGDIIIPESVIFNGQEYVVDIIGAEAFRLQDKVTSVVLPNTIKRIMGLAFNAESITSITIPSSVEYIGWNAAAYAKEVIYNAENAEFELLGLLGDEYFRAFGYNLTKLTVGEDVKILDGRTFRNNSKLTELHYYAINCEITYDFKEPYGYKSPFPKSVTNVEIGSNVVNLPDYVFCGLWEIENMVLPDSLLSIGQAAISGKFSSITIPESVVFLGNFAFGQNLQEVEFNAINCECGNLEFGPSFPETLSKVTIGERVKKIPDYAFASTSISSIDIPETVDSIGSAACWNCPNLQSINIRKNIQYIGGGAFKFCNNLTDLFYDAEDCAIDAPAFPSSINNLKFGNNVRNIPNNAFKELNVNSLIIPNSVESIGEGSFSDCTSLSSIVFPKSLNSIGKNGFSKCSSLSSIVIPENLKTIGASAFSDCSKLSQVYYNAIDCDLIEAVGSKVVGVFPKSVTDLNIGDSVRVIPSYVFSNLSITSILIPQSVKKIGYGAFMGCDNIKEVHAQSLSHWAEIEFEVRNLWDFDKNPGTNPVWFTKTLFINGDELSRKLLIPEGTGRIGSLAFAYLESLVSVSIPASVESIGLGAFYGCSGLQRIMFPSLETYMSIDYNSISSLVNYGNSGNVYVGEELLNKDVVVIPDGVQRIPDYSFFGLTELKTIVIPESVNEIGDFAFANCPKLYDLLLPENLRIIGNGSFNNCEDLGKINIPSQVDSIGESAFARSYVSSVYMPASLKYIGKDAFKDIKYKTWFDSGIISVEDLNSWAKIKFGNEKSNPISATGKLYYNGELVQRLDIHVDSVSDYAFCGAKHIKTARVSAASVGYQAFKDCSSLTDICIDVDEVKKDAFIDNSLIANLYVPRALPPVAHNNSFGKYDGVNLYVPEGALKAYENAENCWWKFLDTHESDFKDLDEIFKADYGNIPVESIMLTPDSWNGEEGESFTIVATILPENATNKSLTWSSDDETIATVDSEGRVSVLKEGNCVITATVTDGSGVYAECIVTGLAGIEGIFSESDLFDIYDLNGILVKKDSDREALKFLMRGIYVIRIGNTMKKIVIR